MTPDGAVAYDDGETVVNLPFGNDLTLALYAVWEKLPDVRVATPVVAGPPKNEFSSASYTVSITCETEGAAIYFTTNGRTPRISASNLYGGPFEITDTTTIIAVAAKGDKTSEYAEVTIVKVPPQELTLETALDEVKLGAITLGGDAEWRPVNDIVAKVGDSCAKSGEIGLEQQTWMEATVSGKGVLTFWWRADCEPDLRGNYTYDHLVFAAADANKTYYLDGQTDWVQQKVTFESEGVHVLRWTYVTDDWEEPGFADCGWVDGVVWTPSAAATVTPTVEGDDGATVTGDAETGFVIKPSEGKTVVEVTIPDGIDAGRVTVEVSPKVSSVKPNGAKVKIVSAGADITELLNVPAVDGAGVVDLTKATVKEEIVKEALDPEKGAKIELNATNPSLTTPNTHKGLIYTFSEGYNLEEMLPSGEPHPGDGKPWTPEIKVKGGKSAFYSIGVGKGE